MRFIIFYIIICMESVYMVINFTNFQITSFDKSNPIHLSFLKSLIKDKTILERFQGFSQHLLHNFGDEFFDRGFFIVYNDTIVGYLDIGNFDQIESCVYLRCAIHKDFRGQNIGKSILNEITHYIFYTYPYIESIRLKIAQDNIPSLKIAQACGYQWLNDDYYGKYNPNHQNIKK